MSDIFALIGAFLGVAAVLGVIAFGLLVGCVVVLLVARALKNAIRR